MKNLFWMLAAVSACCICITVGSCSRKGDPPKPDPVPPSVEPEDPTVCTAQVNLGDISSLPAELQAVLRKRFPNLVSGDEADVCFTGASNAEEFSTRLASGSTTVVAIRGGLHNLNGIASVAGGVLPQNTGLPVLFYAAQKWGKHYAILGDVPEDFTTPEEKTLFYDSRVLRLVHWLNGVEAFKERKRQNTGPLQDNQEPYNYDELVSNIEDEGLHMTYNFPMSLNKFIHNLPGYDYYLKASSSIDMGLRVYPLYKQSCHGDQSGDYYVVTAEITPYNQGMWASYSDDYAWDELFIMGYWFHKMSTHIKLVDQDGNEPAGIAYSHNPLPENAIDSRSYSSGTSTTIGGSVSAGFNGSTPTGSVGLSFSHTVSSSVSYTMEDIDYTLDSSSPNKEVSYMYQSKGVNPTAHDDTDTYYPKNCRTEWTVRQAWVWFVPRGQSGIDDNSEATFKIVLNSRADYRSYWWLWQPIIPNESGETVTYTPCVVEDQIWELPAPNRKAWGLTSIKSEYTDAVMTNIRYYVTGEEDTYPVAVDNMSYHQNDFAFMGLPDGTPKNITYTILYETKNPNTGEHMASWKFENVEVHQGKDKDEATTSLSTVNATKIEE